MEAVADKYHMSFEALRNLVNQLGTQGGLVKERTPIKSGLNEKKHKKEDGMKQSQKLLLTWLIEYDNLYDKIKDIITPEDFTEDIFRKVAELSTSRRSRVLSIRHRLSVYLQKKRNSGKLQSSSMRESMKWILLQSGIRR